MRGSKKNIRARTLLYQKPVPHHRDAISHLGHNRQIVRNEEHSQPKAFTKIGEQFQNLFLYCHVERGRWLISNQQTRTIGNGHRNQNSLSLAA